MDDPKTPADFILEKLAEIKARCDAATKGPWTEYHYTSPRGARNFWGMGARGGLLGLATQMKEPDAVLSAHARTDLPALVASLEELLAYDQNQHALQNAARALGWEAKPPEPPDWKRALRERPMDMAMPTDPPRSPETEPSEEHKNPCCTDCGSEALVRDWGNWCNACSLQVCGLCEEKHARKHDEDDLDGNPS